MSDAQTSWSKWSRDKPKIGHRVSVRSDDYVGEAHQFDERLRAWSPETGYGPDLLLDEDPDAEWTSILENGLPSRFKVD